MLPVAAGAGCMIVLLSAMTAVAEWRNAAPHIGDIAVFNDSAGLSRQPPVRLVVRTAGNRDCTLDLNAMRRSGGSLVIEGRSAKQAVFIVHWAGERTSNDADSCGDNADLLLDRRQVGLLGFTPGGYGVDAQTARGAAADKGT